MDAEPVCPDITYLGRIALESRDGSASCDGLPPDSSADVWYRYTPLTGGTLQVDLNASTSALRSGQEVVLSVHTGCPGTASNEVACSSAFCPEPGSCSLSVSPSVSAGVVYWIRIAVPTASPLDYNLTLTGPDCRPDQDCNSNGVPDVLDVAGGTSDDCNSNGILDECDITGGTSEDCNTNGVPDACDLAGGTSDDCNSNGMVDDCEGRAGARRLFAVEPGGATLYTIDPVDGSISPVGEMRFVGLDLGGGGISTEIVVHGAHGLTTHPVTWELYVLLDFLVLFDDAASTGGDSSTYAGPIAELSGSVPLAHAVGDPSRGSLTFVRAVLIVDPQTAALNLSPFELKTPLTLDNIAFRSDGTLYGIDTGSPADEAGAASRGSPPTLVVLDFDRDEIVPTGIEVAFGDDHAMAFAPGTDFLYHVAGYSSRGDGSVQGLLEAINVESGEIFLLNEDLSGGGYDALAFTDDGGTLLGFASVDFYAIDPLTGEDTFIEAGTAQVSGLSFAPIGSTFDCNGNGVHDDCEVASGSAGDVNSNGLPDECDPDCNSNGIPDDLDVAAATSFDSNDNGVPDECELLDCNTNGIHDHGDIAGGTSADCNTNGVPDECEVRAGDEFYAVSRFGTSLSAVDITDGTVTSLGPLTVNVPDRGIDLGGGGAETAVIVGARSLSLDPPTGKLFAVLELGFGDDLTRGESYQFLATVDPEWLTADLIGILPDDPVRLSDIAIAGDGTIYGVAGNNSPNPGEIFRLDIDESEIILLPTGLAGSDGGGQSITIRPRTNLIYHASSTSISGFDGVRIETIDIDTGGVEVLARFILADRFQSLAFDARGEGLFATAFGTFYSINPDTGLADIVGFQDEGDVVAGMAAAPGPSESDCNTNRVPDECDIAGGTSDDCNDNGLPDECEVRGTSFRDTSPVLSPFYYEFPQSYTLQSPPLAAGDMELVLTALGDLSSSSEVVHVRVNGTPVGTVFANAPFDCGPPNVDVLVVPASLFNFLALAGDLVIDMLPSSSVGSCGNLAESEGGARGGEESFVTVSVRYTIEVDCNDNGVLDECDIASGDSDDCNSNGVPDDCEPDCNSNGVADACDLAGGTSVDVDLNDVPDECELNDCNVNGVDDPDDIAAGTSADCNTNGIPDECDLAAGDLMYAVMRFGSQLWLLDPVTGEVKRVGEIEEIYGSFGLAVDPDDGQLLVLVEGEFGSPRGGTQYVAAVEPDTLNLALLGETSERLSDIAFRSDGTLFGVAGNQASTPGEIFTVDFDTGGVILESTGIIGGPGSGQSITFQPGSELIYHSGGDSLEVIDVTTGGIHLLNPDLQADSLLALSFDRFGRTLYAYGEDPDGLYGIDPVTGADAFVADSLDESVAGFGLPLPGGPNRADCNGNGVPDACDLAGGTSADCNDNGRPDECELETTTGTEVTLANLDAHSDDISALVPDRFDFEEGDFGFEIDDGGEDMYDGGNRLFTNLAGDMSLRGGEIAYTGGTIRPSDFEFGPGSRYFTAKYQGLFVLGATGIAIDRFGIEGNTGADGDGSVDAAELSTVVNQRRYTIFVKRIFDAGDPSINHLIIVPGSADRIDHEYSTDTDDDFDQLDDLDEITEIYYLLVARAVGLRLDDGDALAVAEAFLSNVIRSGGDCNSNGVPDDCDLAGGTSADCNSNGVPDECDPDCNSNGAPDDCDLAAGSSLDTNDNGIPDECEFIDCNSNGTHDADDLAAGSSYDCDGGGIPDECQADCNNNGRLDECDIAAGTSADCNTNGQPDECDLEAPNSITYDITLSDLVDVRFDCGGGSVYGVTSPGFQWLDTHFRAAAAVRIEFNVGVQCHATGVPLSTSLNGFPDTTIASPPYYCSCEPTEGRVVGLDADPGSYATGGLNTFVIDVLGVSFGFVPHTLWGPGVYGRVTVHYGGSNDCDSNGVPDECDLAGGTSSDCDTDGLPDECEVSSGTSGDCDGDGILDTCEFAGGTTQDCNKNGIPDDCDLAGGTSADCNSNGVPDECEFALGTAEDCNSNDLPDACDLAAGTSSDCNTNGRPDECEFVVDASGAAAQDDCADAELVCPGSTYVATTESATIDGWATCDESGTVTGPDVWYRYVPATDGLLRVDTCGSTFDTVLSVLSGCPDGESYELACDDDGCAASRGGSPSLIVDLPVNAGALYLIRVAGHGGATGEFALNLDGPECLSADCNTNGVVDGCDIAAGSSTDENESGTPDECDFMDCNGNGAHDADDLAGGSSPDCNLNGVPDECELPPLYRVDRYLADFHVVNPYNATARRVGRMNVEGYEVGGTFGLSVHPVTGRLYVVYDDSISDDAESGGPPGRSLATLDLGTGQLETIGSFREEDSVGDIAFGGDGTLYAVLEGAGRGVDRSGEIFIVDLSDASLVSTGIRVAGRGQVGVHSIAFQHTTGLLYRMAREVDLPGGASVLEAIDPATGIAAVIGEPDVAEFESLTFDPSGTHLLGYSASELYQIDPQTAETHFIGGSGASLTGTGLAYASAGPPAAADCDLDGVLDACALAGGSPDCNGNGVPDSCDLAGRVGHDCDSNGILDACDIAAATALDGNGNGLIDECELTLHVDQDGGGSTGDGIPDGLSWDTAISELYEAMDVWSRNIFVTRVRVAQGTYRPTPFFTDDRLAAFRLRSNLILEGGYPGAAAPDPDARDVEANETRLSGFIFEDRATRGEGGDGVDTFSYHVVTAWGTNSSAVLDGFTIEDGRADGPGEFGGGGGMFIKNGSPVVRNCTFLDNVAASVGGGGLFSKLSQPYLVNCWIVENRAMLGGGGGGMLNDRSDAVLIDCGIAANFADGTAGGGMLNLNSSPVVVNCEIAGNEARTGAGIYNVNCDGAMVNCLLYSNWATGLAGGVFLGGGSDMTIANCTIADNQAATVGSGIVNLSSNPAASNCILWGNRINDRGGPSIESQQVLVISGSPAINYSCIEGLSGALGGVGNIGDDPRFVAARGPDYRLRPESPCIDAADNTAVPVDSVDVDADGDTAERIPIDLDGSPRFHDHRATEDTGFGTPPLVDMGAYELPCQSLSACAEADVNCDDIADGFDIAVIRSGSNWFRSPAEAANPRADVNGDGVIDGFDIAEVRGLQCWFQ